MKLTAEQIQENYEKLVTIVKEEFSGERLEKSLILLEQFADRIATAPASSINYFHGCYVGGYVVHVLKVIECAKKFYEAWGELNSERRGYTFNELIFSAFYHDLGKIGDLEYDNYIPNESEWHIKNQGKVFVSDPNISNMSIPDRSLWLLQKFGIQISMNEWIAIKVHDGLYLPENGVYLNQFSQEKRLKTNLPIILHQADLTASLIEEETAQAIDKVNEINKIDANKKKIKSVKEKDRESKEKLDNVFDSLFSDCK